MLEVRDIAMSYGALNVLRAVSFVVARGETFAIIGPNGAGKTTLFKALTGERSPTAGTVRFLGEDVTRLPAHRRARIGFGRTFQVARIFGESDVIGNVVVAIEQRRRTAGENVGSLRRWRPLPEVRAEAEAMLAQFGFPRARWSAEANALSHGDRKRLEFCVALATAPKLLMLDEPTAGMSPADRREMTRLLVRLKAETGVTIVMTEHDMDIIFEMADRLMVLDHGEILAIGAPSAVRDDPNVRRVYLGRGRAHA